MKSAGTKFEYEQERNDDLMRAYHELLERYDHICLGDIYKEVVDMPSARFWVSEERAAIVLSAIMKGDDLGKMRPTKREMFMELYRRFLELREEYPRMSLLKLAYKAVRQPAPKFFISAAYAESIITHARKKWYEERRRKLRHLY